MQPTLQAIDTSALRSAWEYFAGRGKLAAQPAIDPVVALSWRRCLPLINPRAYQDLPRVGEQALQQLRIQHFELIAIARPFMEDVHQFIEGLGYLVLLLDASGCVLEILGDADMLAAAGTYALTPGTYWDEGHAGTNGFGLALLQRAPVWVVGAEHFCERFHPLSSAAAPLYSPTGQLIGLIGLACLCDHSTPHALGIVHAAARAIDNQLQTDHLVNELNAQRTQLEVMLEAISDGVVACDVQGVVMYINKQAGQILDLRAQDVVGRTMREFVELPESVQQASAERRPLSEVEAVFKVRDRQVACLINLYPVRAFDGQATVWILAMRRIEQVHRLVQRLVGTRANIRLADFAGNSGAIANVRRHALQAARSASPVLLQGETGTGKYLLAHAIHNESPRAAGAFVTVNCRALPRDLVLSEFLGREDTRAGHGEGQPSKFELAQGGTIHLEEIEALPFEVQAALLRVIETREVLRLGGTRSIPVDVRFIASTAADLERRVMAGDLRADLYFALSPTVIDLPALRERISDLPQLMSVTLERLARQSGRPIEVSREALGAMRHYRWPGNVRELEAVLERAAALAEGGVIELRHLPPAVRGRQVAVEQGEPVASLREHEREAILRAGWACQGNVSKMAAMLGIGRTSLWRKMKAYEIRAGDFRNVASHASADPD